MYRPLPTGIQSGYSKQRFPLLVKFTIPEVVICKKPTKAPQAYERTRETVTLFGIENTLLKGNMT